MCWESSAPALALALVLTLTLAHHLMEVRHRTRQLPRRAARLRLGHPPLRLRRQVLAQLAPGDAMGGVGLGAGLWGIAEGCSVALVVVVVIVVVVVVVVAVVVIVAAGVIVVVHPATRSSTNTAREISICEMRSSSSTTAGWRGEADPSLRLG